MNGLDHQWATRVLSGEERGLGPASLRVMTSIAEPFYSFAMRARNFAYDRRLRKIHPLPRPTISIGNLTTGGTGKTPVVRWIAEQFISRGRRPAVLLRGYRDDATGGSDEAQLLAEALGDRGIVAANRDRVAGARSAMSKSPPPDIFLLDDGFQHRRVARDFDLVLIDATQPFGFDHALPRGLMRESPRGLRRADALIITRSDQIPPPQLESLKERLRSLCGTAPIYLARHAISGLLSASSSAIAPIDELSRSKFFAFAGIANPGSLREQLNRFGDRLLGFCAFRDHHAYTVEDLADLRREAKSAGAQMLVTTEKDWVKLRTLATSSEDLPIVRLDLRIDFLTGGADRLLKQLVECVDRNQSPATNPAQPAR